MGSSQPRDEACVSYVSCILYHHLGSPPRFAFDFNLEVVMYTAGGSDMVVNRILNTMRVFWNGVHRGCRKKDLMMAEVRGDQRNQCVQVIQEKSLPPHLTK